MLEPQPLGKNVRARYENDIEPQKLCRYSQSRMDGRDCVVPLMQNLRERWLYLLLKRRPHHQSDHHKFKSNTVVWQIP